jgi:hypothetical protein
MFTPTIAPRRIMKTASAGLFSAARNSVRNLRTTTRAISNVAQTPSSSGISKNQKFSMNFIEFFGSKKTTKILQKSLKTIRDSLVETFEIAKILRKEVAENMKSIGKGGAKKRGGLFGGLFGAIGSILGTISFFTNPIILGFLGLLGAGAIGTLLFTYRKEIISFLKKKASGFRELVDGMIENYINRKFKTTQALELEELSDDRIKKDVEELTTRKDDPLNLMDATAEANKNEIGRLENLLSEEKAKKKNNTDDPEAIKLLENRIKQLKTGENPLDNIPFPLNMFSEQIKESVSDRGKFSTNKFGKVIDFRKLDRDQKLQEIKKVLGNFKDEEDINDARKVYQMELESSKSTAGGTQNDVNKAIQAREILNFLDAIVDPSNIDNEEILKELEKNYTPSSKNVYDQILIDSKPKSQQNRTKLNLLRRNYNRNVSSNVMPKSGPQVAMLPMGNGGGGNLERNDTGGLIDGPSVAIHSNINGDNHLSQMNAVTLGIV